MGLKLVTEVILGACCGHSFSKVSVVVTDSQGLEGRVLMVGRASLVLSMYSIVLHVLPIRKRARLLGSGLGLILLYITRWF